MTDIDNPIVQSIDYLVDAGWTREQARHLCAAIKSDLSGEHLWEIAPLWIEHAAGIRQMLTLLETVATGLVDVHAGPDGQWLYSLNATGLKVGAQMAGAAGTT